MKLHCMSHNICHFVESAVVHAFHRMEYTSLNGLQSVLNIRHGTFKNHVRGIIQKPTLVHPAEVVYHRRVKTVGRLIIGMSIRPVVRFDFFIAYVFFYFFNVLRFVTHCSNIYCYKGNQN